MRIVLGALLLAMAAGAQERPRGGAPAPPSPAVPPAPAVAAGVPAPKDLKYPPLRAIQTPAVATFTLPNGMKLFLLEDHDVPLVGGIALVRTGSLLDPPQRIGLAQLAGIMLRTGGTTLKTGEQLDVMLDNLAATVEAGITDSQGTLSFNVLKENAPATLQLFKELIVEPGFRQDKLDVAKAQVRTAISHRNDNARMVAHREFASLTYGPEGPFGWQPEYATLERIARQDLREFHQRYFFPANTMLGVCGDFNTLEMKASIEKLFADWTVRQPPVPAFPKVNPTPAPGIFLAEKKDAPQTFFSIGHLGGQRNDKDHAALEILAGILGGGPRGRIGERLRTKLGVPNEVAAAWTGAYAYPGLFEISGSTKSFSTVATIQAIREEIERLRTAEVTEDEWRNARDAAVNSLAFGNDRRTKLFALLMLLDYYGYPKDYLAQLQKAMQSVTRADLLRVAKQYLNPANLTVTVAGNPAMFGDSLEKLGAVTKLDLTIPEPARDTAPSSDASLAQGKQILLRAQVAAGGAEKLAAVKDYTLLAEYLIDPSVPNIGGSRLLQTDRWVAPSIFRQETTIPSGRVSAYTDGKVGWISTPQGWGALTGTQRSQMQGDLFRVYFRMLLSERIEGRSVNAITDSSVQIADATGQVTTVEFDPRTHLPVRASYDTQQAAGPPIYSEDVYEDFREVDGIKIPFKIVISQGGHKFCDQVVKEYKINTGLNPLELARRPQ